MNLDDKTIAVIGLGYVGLPLALAFGATRKVVGFDMYTRRIEALRRREDATLEASAEDFETARHLSFSSDPQDLQQCGVFIVTVPTPIDKANRPDLTPLLRASETVGKAISPGAVIIFESTVYPGCTEEVCAPIIARESGLELNRDFSLGYAGDKLRDALRRIGKWTIEIIKRSDTAKGFEVLPRRWVVERTLAWLNRNRRLAKDFEHTIASETAWLFIASVQLFTRRIARLRNHAG